MAERLYVLGHPVAHSKSPDMHNAAYRALGLDWTYGFADCADESAALAFLRDGSWLGLNVTMPYKPLAFQEAIWRSPDAQLAQGANVLVRRGRELLADNTDGRGCVSYLRRCGVAFEGATVAVCGTGPTSLALFHAAAQAGAAKVVLLGRDGERARRKLRGYLVAAEQAGVPMPAYADAGSYERQAQTLREAAIILDATPLGMRPGDPTPFDTRLLSAGQVVFDVVYGHGTTALMAAARAAGCPAYDGAGMLVAQAVETVRDLIDWLEVPVDPQAVDLFAVMAEAAGWPNVTVPGGVSHFR